MMANDRSSVGLTAAELTAQNLDKSALLDDAIQRVGGDADELLAEFQLAFVMFLYGQSLEGEPETPCRCSRLSGSLLMLSAFIAPQPALDSHWHDRCTALTQALHSGSPFCSWR